MRLQDKVAIVTGGASGIGAAICRAFDAEGAAVGVLDLDEGAAATLAASLQRAVGVRCDVTDSAAVDAGVARVVAELGGLDVLVNNAGITGKAEIERMRPAVDARFDEAAAGRITTPLEATVGMSDQEWRIMLSTHLDGTFYGTRAAIAPMLERGGGVIINIASICGIEGCTGAPHYSAAKAGILGLTRATAKELITQNIRVNAIAPGYVETPLLDPLSDRMKAAQAVTAPIGRLGRPEEIAAVALFLACDDASFFVGETVSPNGGYVTT